MPHRTPAQVDSPAGLWIEALILGVLSVAPTHPVGYGAPGDWRRLQHMTRQGAVYALASALGAAIGWGPNDCAFGWSEPGR